MEDGNRGWDLEYIAGDSLMICAQNYRPILSKKRKYTNYRPRKHIDVETSDVYALRT
jgi:hypothetical protein